MTHRIHFRWSRYAWSLLLGYLILIPHLAVAQSGSTTNHSPDKATYVGIHNAVLKTSESTIVPAQVQGTIEALKVREGSEVRLGQVLGRLGEASIQNDLKHQATQVRVAEFKAGNDINLRLASKSYDVAKNEYDRALKANARVPDTYPVNEIDRLRLVSDHAQLEVERAKYEMRVVDFEVQLAKVKYDQLLLDLNKHQIKSPVNGMVVAIDRHVGEWVEPGVELLRIVRLDRLRVEGFVDLRETSASLVGKPIEVLVQTPSTEEVKRLTGTVTFVSPEVNTVNAQVRVFGEIENPGGVLRAGSSVTASIDLSNPGDEANAARFE